MRTRIIILVAGACLAASAPLAGQAWDSPMFLAPRPGEDLGLYFTRPEGSDWGIMGIWRQEGNLNLGVRAGLAEGNHVLVGTEMYGSLPLMGPQSGIMTMWVLGVGATFNDVTWLRIPAGISFGANLGAAGGLQVKPYVLPRVALDIHASDNNDGDEVTDTEVTFDLDLGADVSLGQAFVLRVGATLGNLTSDGRTNTIGVGIAYRTPRRVTVR